MPSTYGPLRLTFRDRDQWTLSNVLGHRARTHSDKVFLSEPPARSYTYGEVDVLAGRIASGLMDRGMAKGDRLMILLPNCSEYVLAWFGAARAGIVEVPTNIDYFGDFLDHVVRLTTPAGIVVSAAYAERFVDIADSVAEVKPHFFVVGRDDELSHSLATLHDRGWDAEPFESLLHAPAREGSTPPHYRHALASLLFTSGTTGRSKAVMMSEAQLYFFAEQGANLVRLGENDVYLTSNPLFHGNAQFLAVYPVLIKGASVVLYEKFSANRWLTRVRESGATVTNFVGVMMSWVFQQSPTPHDADNRLRCILAAPTVSSIASQFQARFGIEAFVEAYGQTEISLPIMTPYGVDRPAGAAGVAVDEWFDIRLADPETDDPVAQGEVGELQVRPKEPWIVNSGYWGMPEATAEARRNLWLHTGDGVRRDAAGWYYFIDRLKDCLRRRGENVSSQEVEAPILAHPAVADCAVVGVPADDEGGEDEIKVFVVVKDGASLTPPEIVEWAETRLPRSFVPRYVEVVDALPLTPNGKVQKAKLRTQQPSDSTWDRFAAESKAPR